MPGFDLALGNPPWERIKLQEQEFFASRDPGIATAPNAAARRTQIAALQKAPEGTAKRALYEEFAIAKRIAEASSVFARTDADDGGRFPLAGTGDVNTYALFTELFALAAHRAGVIVPTGIATDATTAPFFANLVEKKRLRALTSFREIRRWFTETDDRNSFCLLALAPQSKAAAFAFSLDAIDHLRDPHRQFELAPAEIAAINPNTRTAPIFRSKADAELTKQIFARVPVLIDDTKGTKGNPWGVTFSAMFHMSGDSDQFQTSVQLAGDGLSRDGRDWISVDGKRRFVPLYEAKMIHHFDHRWATYEDDIGDDASRNVLPTEKADPNFESVPRYWVLEGDVADRLAAKNWPHRWLMGWRDICRATDERTTISGVIPRSGVGDKFLLMMPSCGVTHAVALSAILSSLAFDFIARQKLGGTSFKYFTMKQIALPTPNSISAADLAFINSRVLELTYTSHAMRPFADDLSFKSNSPFAWDEPRRAILRAELDAKIAKLYGLTRDQLRYILDPADVYGPDYPSETFRVLKNNDIAKYSEYRTAKLVLHAYDQLTAGTLSTEVVRLDSSKIDVRTDQPRIAVLADGAWSRPRTDARGEMGAMLVALLKSMKSPMPMRQVRLSAVLGLEPRLLVPMLDKKQAAEWRRLVGKDTDPLPKGTVQFVPSADQNWGQALRGLFTRENVIEDTKAGTWAPGKGLDKIETDGWPDGRASFVLDVLAKLGDQPAVDKLPEAVRRWVDAEAA